MTIDFQDQFEKLQELVAHARSTPDHIGDCILAAFWLGEGRSMDDVDHAAYRLHRRPVLTVVDGGKGRAE